MGPSTTAFFLSVDGALDATDLFLGSRIVPALGVGGSSTGSTSVVIPAATPGGTYTIIAVGDVSGTVAELDETNNIRTKTLTIGPDLSVPRLTGPTSAAVGATISVTDTTLNQGSAAPASTTTFYLSAGTVRAPGDPDDRQPRRARAGAERDEHHVDRAHDSRGHAGRGLLHHRGMRRRPRGGRAGGGEQHQSDGHHHHAVTAKR